MLHLLIGLILSCSFAQSHHMQGVQREDPSYRANGNLILFIAVPKKKSLRLYLAGKEAVEMKLGSEAKLLSVHLLENDKKRDLQFNRVGNAYEILGLPTKGKFDLDVKAEISNQSDSVRMSIDLP